MLVQILCGLWTHIKQALHTSYLNLVYSWLLFRKELSMVFLNKVILFGKLNVLSDSLVVRRLQIDFISVCDLEVVEPIDEVKAFR